MRILLIKFLLRLLTRERKFLEQISEKKIKDFLTTNYRHQGLHDYIHLRDINLLQEIGEGVEDKRYWITIGRRMELNYLLSQAKKAFKRNDKNENN